MTTRRELIQYVTAMAGTAFTFPCSELCRAEERSNGSDGHVVPGDGRSDEPRVREGMADIDGGRLFYWDTGGNGEAIVFDHAGTGSALSWPHQQRAFAAQGYRVIGYSRRGHYQSTFPPAGANPVDDLLGLLNALSLTSVHLIGTAAGGGNVARFAIRYPERVRTLTISCSTVGIDAADYRAMNDGLAAPGFAEMPAAFRELGPSYRATNPGGVAQWLAIEKTARDSALPRGTTPPLSWAAMEPIRNPTHLVFGGADLYAPPPLGRLLHEHVPRSELTVIYESGHSAFWEQPGLFNDAVLGFLSRRDGN